MRRDLPKFLYIAAIVAGLAVSSTPAQSVPFGSSLKGKSKVRPSENKVVSPPAPETSQLGNEGDYERVETRIVVSDVEVFDKKGSRVIGLTANDFEIREEGELQEAQSVTFAEHAANGRWIILVLDYSASILPYMETSLSGAETLVQGMRPNDSMAIVTDDVEQLTDFTSDKTLLLQSIGSLRERLRNGKLGKSRQFCALMAAIRELTPKAAQRPIVIFQTDGDQFVRLKGGIGEAANRDAPVRYSFDDVVRSARGSGTSIYSIVPGRFSEELSTNVLSEMARAEEQTVRSFYDVANPKIGHKPAPVKLTRDFLRNWYETRKRDRRAIADVAVSTGGWAENLEDPTQADAIYSRILRDADQRYIIAYYPKNLLFSGERRNVVVSIRNNPGLSIRGRKSYTAQ